MQDLEKLFSDPIEHEKMIKRLAEKAQLERVREEICEYFTSEICRETGNDNIVSAWETYKRNYL